jgi:hypothetical protein
MQDVEIERIQHEPLEPRAALPPAMAGSMSSSNRVPIYTDPAGYFARMVIAKDVHF